MLVMLGGVQAVAMSDLRMVRRLFVLGGFVVLCSLAMVLCCMLMMFSGLLMVLVNFVLRHFSLPVFLRWPMFKASQASMKYFKTDIDFHMELSGAASRLGPFISGYFTARCANAAIDKLCNCGLGVRHDRGHVRRMS
jgi:hypothetical protein